MFAQLLASRPARRRSPGGFAVSLVLHSILVIGATALTTRAVRRPEPRMQTPLLVVPTPPPRREPAPTSQGPLFRGPVTIINVPIDVPMGLPPVDPLRAAISLDDPLMLRPGEFTRHVDAVAPIVPGAAFDERDVEVPVVVDPRSPLPVYPQWLRDAGVEGSVRARFVVDTLGRAELATVEVINTSHAAFTDALRLTLPRMRFVPARIGSHRVRQLVEFPIEFRLNR